jgi:hypothetical protein
LLPGTAGSFVLITSRRGLTALEDTVVITLDTLPQVEAGRSRPGWLAAPGWSRRR